MPSKYHKRMASTRFQVVRGMCAVRTTSGATVSLQPAGNAWDPQPARKQMLCDSAFFSLAPITDRMLSSVRDKRALKNAESAPHAPYRSSARDKT